MVTDRNRYMAYGHTNVGNVAAYSGLSSTMTATRITGQDFIYSDQVLASTQATMNLDINITNVINTDT